MARAGGPAAHACANGVGLLEQALNLKSPAIYDVFERDGKEERVLNQEETLAARDKQKAIKKRFRIWIFADPDRTERLVRLYNETYNNLRLRRFDGSHLAFPGMSPHITLYPHCALSERFGSYPLLVKSVHVPHASLSDVYWRAGCLM
jgi:N12 class adenine-specific DNA methylase